MSEIEKAAEILVECGYADGVVDDGVSSTLLYWEVSGGDNPVDDYEVLDPFADTLEGRRQADAIEDYLSENRPELLYIHWDKPDNQSNHQWRIDRVKWCLEQLTGEDNEQKPNS